MNTGNTKLKISVIIPTFNRPADLARAIKSIQYQSMSADEYEILVVDNSKEGYAKGIVAKLKSKKYPQIHYIHEPKTGLHYARHAGATHASGMILSYCDDDIIASKAWLEEIYTAFDNGINESIGAVGGKVIGKYGKELPDWYGYFGDSDNCGVLSILHLGNGIKVLDNHQNIYGCNYSVLRSVLYECGGFNPDIFYPPADHLSGDGETGLLDKLRLRGYKVAYNSNAYVYHVIPVERLTEKYFMIRYQRQGLTRAYTVYRYLKGKVHLMHIYIYMTKIRYYIYSIMCELHYSTNRKIYYRAMQVYCKTIIDHCKRIMKNQDLQKFVLKESYLET